MERLFGLPAHPLVVHVPVVLLPLAAIGVLVTLIRPSWYFRYRWATLVIGLVGAIGTVLATSSGEALEEGVEGTSSRELLHEHAESGELARTVALVFAIALVAWVVVPWFVARQQRIDEERDGPAGPRWLRPALMVVVAVTALASVVTVVDAGHSGADSVWNGVRAGEEEHDDD